MKLNKNFAVSLLIIPLLSCGEKIPVKEMSLAKMEITRALSVMAEKYAPEEIRDAKNKILECHELIKKDELDKSKDAAVASHDKAVEAYNKSIPLLAKDTIDVAQKSLEIADEAHAKVLAKNEFEQAEGVFQSSNKLYEDKMYYEAYLKAVEADSLAKDARNVALGRKNVLRDAIDEVKSTVAEAQKYNAQQYAPDKISAASENIGIAETSYNDLLLKKGFAAVEIAGANADEAYALSLKGTATDKAANAETIYNQAVKSEGAEAAKDELAGAKEALDRSRSLLDETKYKESIALSEESVRLSNLVLGSLYSSAGGKIASAEALLAKAKGSEGASIAVKELTGAAASLELSKSLFSAKKYKEAIAAAEESERLSNIVLNARKGSAIVKDVKQGGTEVTGSGDQAKDFLIYKVRYIPERRDCLWRIADKFYKVPLYWKKIYQANTDQIKDPDLIWPDMKLKIPILSKQGSEKKGTQETDIKDNPANEAVKEEGVPEETETGEEVAN